MKRMIKMMITTLSLGVLGLGISSASQAEQLEATEQPSMAEEQEQKDSMEAIENDDLTETLMLQQQTALDLKQAIQTAERSANGAAFGAELEREKDKVVYFIDIGNQEIQVDANNGEILGTEAEQDAAAQYQRLTQVSLLEAVQLAEQSTGGQAFEADLEVEDIGLVYRVAIANQELYLDPGSGEILYRETESEDAIETNRPRSSIQVR